MNDIEKNALEALDRFIGTFNSRNAKDWSESLNYPHVRPNYESNVDFRQTVDMGWDHSEWDHKRIIHLSEKKVHAAGQYTRYTSEGKVIWSNEVMYIITKVWNRWGIQARFGIDQVAAPKPETNEVESVALDLIKKLINAVNVQSTEKIASLLNYTYIAVDTGSVESFQNEDKFREKGDGLFFHLPENWNNSELSSFKLVQHSKVSLNVAADIDHFDEEGSKCSRSQAVYLITHKAGKWGIQASSMIET
jgi:hypothetical protein